MSSIQKKKLSRSGLLSLSETAHLAAASPRFAYGNLKYKMFSRRLPAFPHFLVLHLNNSCNMACPMCSIGLSRKSHMEQGMVRYMPIDLIEKLAREARPHGALVTLFGGEPLLYPELGQALRVFRDNNLLSDMVSNGLLLEKKAELLVEGGLNILLISLDGWDEETQLKRGKVPGSFAAIAAGIERVRRLRGSSTFPILRVATTVTKNNFHSLNKIQKVIREWGVQQWVINHYQFVTPRALEDNSAFHRETGIGQYIAGDRIGDRPYFSSEHVAELKRSLAEVREEQSRNGMRIYHNWSLDLDAYYSPLAPNPGAKCVWPFTRVDIQADGSVFLCHEGSRVGDVSKEALHEAWTGEKASQLRSTYRKLGVFPMCYRCCGMYDSATFPLAGPSSPTKAQ